jgi:choline dehydrogenase
VGVQAKREVLLCAGALQSPQLLQLSGIGPRSLLESFGIPILCDLPGVGENLQDHLQARVIFECTRPITTNDDLASWWRTLRMGLVYVLTRSGPMAIGINQGGIFARVGPGAMTPDVQFHVATLSSDMAGSPTHPFSGFTFSVCQLRPESRGYVRIKSPDPMDPPAMQPNYLAAARDREILIAGIRLARRLAATRALSPYVKREYRPGPDADCDDALLEFARNTGGTIFHPSGTCKMSAPDDPMGVVDERLRVRGVEAMRVVDCSIMPTLVSGNTNVPVVMIAEKAADMILADTGK